MSLDAQVSFTQCQYASWSSLCSFKQTMPFNWKEKISCDIVVKIACEIWVYQERHVAEFGIKKPRGTNWK